MSETLRNFSTARFHNYPLVSLEGLLPVSFDMVSVYTNIDIEEAISTALKNS